MTVVIRRARAEDCKDICNLIKELADYEGYKDRVKVDEQTLINDGFGETPYYHCLVAEMSQEEVTAKKHIVGYCLYFFIYSTWEGRSVYMEDLYVQPEHRKKGIGMSLWRKLAQLAVAQNCKRLDFAVLNWNESSITFYEKVGAMNQTKNEGWNMFRLNTDALQKFASKG